MEWSISKSKIFAKCPRKWYYYAMVANPRSNDPLRKEAYHLKQLQSVFAWRGSLVDSVIQHFLVPEIRKHNLPSEEKVLEYASQLMEKQIAFGQQKKHLCDEVTKSTTDGYCAFFDIEYGQGLAEADLQKAKEDVAFSLKNLLHSEFLKDIVENNLYTIAQRELGFQLDADIQITATPDMVVFFKDRPPTIVDWKVHAFGNTEAWLQLGIYAIALCKTKPHKDFPNGWERLPSNIRLIEFQLLKNFQREYSIKPEDIVDIEDYAYESSLQMKRVVNGKKYPELDAAPFQTARSPGDCEKCQFKKLCWKNTIVRKEPPVQMLLGGFVQ
jgi:hypothetical protein